MPVSIDFPTSGLRAHSPIASRDFQPTYLMVGGRRLNDAINCFGIFGSALAQDVVAGGDDATRPRDGWSSFSTPADQEEIVFVTLCRDGTRRRGFVACPRRDDRRLRSASSVKRGGRAREEPILIFSGSGFKGSARLVATNVVASRLRAMYDWSYIRPHDLALVFCVSFPGCWQKSRRRPVPARLQHVWRPSLYHFAEASNGPTGCFQANQLGLNLTY